MVVTLLRHLIVSSVASLMFATSAQGAEKVKAMELGSAVEYPQFSATATAISLNDVTLSAQITATIAEVVSLVGEHVKKDATLAKLDCRDYALAEEITQAELDAAKANRELTLIQHERSQSLLKKKLTSQQDADEKLATYTAATAQSRLAEAQLNQAKINVSRCAVKAPFDGVVSTRHVALGQLATPGTPLYSLIEDKHLEVAAHVSEQDAGKISRETEVFFQNQARYPVTLVRTVDAVDRRTRTREMRFVFLDKRPLPGSAGKIHWQSPQPYLPAKYLVSLNGVTGYFIADGNVARFIAIPGAFPGRAQVIATDLSSMLLVPPVGGIRDGDKVELSIGPPE
jgi:membrane fusion protein, multidrug efflux system